MNPRQDPIRSKLEMELPAMLHNRFRAIGAQHGTSALEEIRRALGFRKALELARDGQDPPLTPSDPKLKAYGQAVATAVLGINYLDAQVDLDLVEDPATTQVSIRMPAGLLAEYEGRAISEGFDDVRQYFIASMLVYGVFSSEPS